MEPRYFRRVANAMRKSRATQSACDKRCAAETQDNKTQDQKQRFYQHSLTALKLYHL